MFTSNLYQFHSRKEKLLHLSWCNYPKTLAFKTQDCIFLTVSKAYNCRARELGLGNVVSVSGLPEVVTPRESLGDNHWNISVLIQCLQQVSREAMKRLDPVGLMHLRLSSEVELTCTVAAHSHETEPKPFLMLYF